MEDEAERKTALYVCETMQWKEKDKEKKKVIDRSHGSRERWVQHVNTNAKSLGGFDPAEISAIHSGIH